MVILKSKKFQVFVASLIMLALTQLASLDEAAALNMKEGIMALAGTYLIGQGVADHGKEAAKAAQA